MATMKQWRKWFGNGDVREAGRLAAPPRRRRLRVEALEDRLVPTATLYLDFGDSFTGANGLTTNGTNNVTENDFVTMVNGPNLTNTGTNVFTFTSFAAQGAAAGLTAAQITTMRNDIITLVQRYYAPFDVNIVVAAAATLQNVQTTLASTGTSDAYVFLAGITSSGGGIGGGLNGQAGGNEFNTFVNTTDDTAVVLANNLFTNGSANLARGDTAFAYTTAHEAAHTFGLDHTANGVAGDNRLLTTSDVISQFYNSAGSGNAAADQRSNFNFFTRFSLPRAHFAGNYVPYDRLAGNVGLRANPPAYVTGTGAFDQITITRTSATTANVAVQAHRTNAFNAGSLIATFPTYSINTTNGILIEGGFNQDQITIDGTIAATITVRGMGNAADVLIVNGGNLANATYTPAGAQTPGLDGNNDFRGQIVVAGGATVNFQEFQTTGSVTVQNVTTLTLVTPNSADSVSLTTPAAGQTQASGSSDAVAFVPLIATGVANLVVDTATNDGAGTGADSVSINLTSGPTASLVVNTGAGGDTVTVDNLGAGFNVPLQINADGGVDILRVLNTTVTYTPDGTNLPGQGTLTAYGSKTIQFTDFEFVTPVAPDITSVGVNPAVINENGSVTLSVGFTDPGSLSSHSVTIAWGDGAVEVVNLAVGVRTITRIHQYLDDNPTGTPQDVYPIQITVRDNDNLTDVGNTWVTVNNVAPDITNLAATAINENDETTLAATFFDPGTRDTHTVVIDWDDPNNSTDSTFQLSANHLLAVGQLFNSTSDDAVLEVTAVDPAFQVVTFRARHRYLDDGLAPGNNTPRDTSTAVVRIADDDTGTDNDTTPVVVNNVDPVITSHDTSSPSGDKVEEGDLVTVAGTFFDVGTLDLHTVTLDWGDGTVTSGTVDQLARTFAGQHAYSAGGIFTVTITLSDDDTGVATAVETIFVTGAGVQTIGGKQVLFVVGSNEADHVVINQVGQGEIRVHADFLHDQGMQRTFSQPVDQIRIVLCDGDDHATIAGNVAIPALLDGGKGNDHLNAGGMGSLVLGGPGDDMLLGSIGRDILIGGAGRDRLIGNGGEDILIGGLTAFTDGADDAILTNQASLFAILDEWNSGRGIQARRDNISGTPNPEFASRLNGNNFLQLGVTVTDDGDVDVLTGGSGANWFFVFANDILTDFNEDRGDVMAT